MLIEKFYREDVIALREDLEALEQILESARQGEWKGLLEGTSELEERLERFDSYIVKELKRARRILDDIENDVNARGLSSFGLLLAATALSLQSEARGLEASLMTMESHSPRETETGSVDRLLNWVRGIILPVVGRIIGSVWKILINILPAHSWKVKGGIGAAFPGLAEGELVIEFGKSH
jgi:hypothetical protein